MTITYNKSKEIDQSPIRPIMSDKTPIKVYGRKPVCCFWMDDQGIYHHQDGGPPQYQDYPGQPDRTIDASPPARYSKFYTI